MQAIEYSNIRPNFPSQKRSIRQKDKKWIEECANAAINITIYNPDVRLRATKRNIKANYNLVNGIIDMKDVEETINPFGFDMKQFPNAFNHYPIINNKLNVLIGEEASMLFQWRLKVINEDAVSEKEKFIKQTIIDELMAIALADIPEEKKEEVAKQKSAELQKWAKYEAQDIRERIGTQILKHLWQEQKLKLKFNQGFKDWLIAGEEIYSVDIFGRKPVVRRCDPLAIWTVGMGNSPYIEDSEIIVEDTYQPPGWIIDAYYDELTSDQISKIEQGLLLSTPVNSSGIVNYPAQDFTENFMLGGGDSLFDATPLMIGGTGSIYDADGNLRVTMVTWKSRRQIQVVESFDEDGFKVREIYDELMEFPKELGINPKKLWVNEWWAATRIGQDIFVKGGPKPYQARSMDNLSISKCGYVGTICNTSLSKARSLVDVMKPYNYAYDTIAYRLDKAMGMYKGPMIEMDFAKMPEGWDAEKWLYIAEESGYLYVDSFKEGQKGAAKGVLAGIYNTTGKILNPEMGTYIRDLRDHMMFIQNELDAISGITRQREGAIDNRETVGGVERSVTQSSHSTRELFFVHEQTKLRVLETLIDVAKGVYVDDNIILQYISDTDLAQEIYRIDGRLFREADYGLVATDGSQYTDMKNTLIQLAHAGIQNGVLNFSKFIDIYMSDDIASTRRKIEQYEEENIQREQENTQAQQKHEMEMLQREIENREDIQAHQMEIETLKSNTQIELKLMELEAKSQEVEAPTVEDNSMDIAKLEQDREKFQQDNALKTAQFQEVVRATRVKEKQKDEEIAIKKKQANKPKTSK
jgi:hypothetical protein